MNQFLLRRIAISIPLLLVISMIIFGILALAPGDPMAEFATDPSVSAEVRQNIRQSLGLDEPLPVRYGKWLSAFVQGDMGYSFASRSPVRALLGQRIATTLAVVGTAYLLSVLLAVPLGMLAALRPYSVFDQVSSTLAFVGFSLPTFFTGLLCILLFSVRLGWFPLVYNSTLVVSDWPSLLAQLRQSAMPIGVLTLFQTATMMRFMRSAALEQIYRDYVRTARAKGLHERVVVNRHILRNALIPVVTLVALGVPSVFTGALVTEQVFRVPGIGGLLVSSIQSSDTPVVMAITCIYALLIVIFNLVADMLYGVLDPRVRYT
ncbi:ABC transporter permease [Chloroflexia bacterium SDU3-3]|nr:ABC transporter permease [Chloroflexia bacterium SDU3-3]